jgi:ABC-2 family transporter protein
MTWLVWRQHRKQALFALLALAALAAFLIPTGLQMHREFDRAGLDDCLRTSARAEFVTVNPDPSAPPDAIRACQERADEFGRRFGGRGTFGVLLWFLPLFAGLFWGAPLVAREVEHGTHRLVWTQGVSRLRWAVVKFGLVGAGVVLAAACYALLLTWWRAPLDQVATGTAAGNKFGFLLFDLEGLVPVGYALFAVALGVFAGVLTRRTQAAMAVTLVGYMATRLVVEFLARPRFLAPLRRTYPVIGTQEVNAIGGDWVIKAGVYNAEGARLAGGTFGNYSSSLCPPATTLANTPPTTNPCLLQYGEGAYNLQLFHPADRYWLFQGIETALFVALAVLLLLAAVHWVRRRIS